jgi:outer membrane protein
LIRRVVFWIVVLLQSGTPIAIAADGGMPTGESMARAVTLQQAVRAALAHHQPFQMAQESLYQLTQQRREVFSALLPTLTLEGLYTGRTEPEGVLFNGSPILPKHDRIIAATLKQPLFAGGRVVAGLQVATTQVKAGEQSLSQTKEALVLDVADAFYAVLKAQTQQELFDAEVKRLREHRQSAEARLRVGDVTKTVLLRAEAELAGAEASRIRAHSDIAIAKERLALLTGLPPDLEVNAPSAPVPPEGADEQLVTEAEVRRPELMVSRLQRQSAEQSVRVARAGFFPTLSLELTYEDHAQTPQTSFLVEHDKFALLKLTVPIFEGGLQMAKIQEARSQLRAAALNAEYVRESVGAEVRSTLYDLESLKGRVEQFTVQVRFAKENYELTARQFAVGLTTNLDLLDANSTLLTAEQQRAMAVYDRDLAVFRLYRTLGRLSIYLLGE